MKIATLNFPNTKLTQEQYERVHEIVQKQLGDEFQLLMLPADGVLTMPRDEAILASLLRIEKLLQHGIVPDARGGVLLDALEKDRAGKVQS